MVKLKGGGRKRKRENSSLPPLKKKKRTAKTQVGTMALTKKRRESIRGIYSPNNPRSECGRDGVRYDKNRVRHIRQEARSESDAIITSYTL